MDKSELLKRIRKCLVLAKSDNENEAATALAKARALMDEYGVDQSDIELLEVDIAAARGSGNFTPSRWETMLTQAVSRAIPCKPILLDDRGWAFVGITPAPEIASYAFQTLYRQLKHARREYINSALKRVASSTRKTARADAYSEGWSFAVVKKIAALYPEQPENDLVDKFLQQRFGAMTNVMPRSGKANDVHANRDRDAGWDHGKKVDLNKGVGGNSPTLALK